MDNSKLSARAKRQKMMLEDPMFRVIPRVAVPMIISSIIDSIYNLADTFFVSGLGETATAAVAVNDSLMNILRSIAMGFALGAAAIMMRLGRRELLAHSSAMTARTRIDSRASPNHTS